MLALAVITFLVVFVSVGRYQPNIPPPPPVPNPNGLDDYIAAANLFAATGGDKAIYGPNGKPVLANEVRVVARNKPALARLRVGLARKCGIPFDARLESTFPYLAGCRSLARLLGAEADVDASRSRYLPAAMAALDSIQLGTDIQRGGMLIHGLTGNALQAIGQSALFKVYGKLSAAECEQVMARLQQIIRNRVPVDDVLRSEYRWTLKYLTDYRGSSWDAGGSGDSEDYAIVSSARRFADDLSWHFARDKTLREIERYMAALLAEAPKPASIRKNPPVPGGFAGDLVPVFDAGLIRLRSADLRNRLFLIEIAIRRYRLNHASLPESLDALGLDPQMIVDPESGNQIIYRRTGQTYLLYGVGADGKDDGGVPVDEGREGQRGDQGIRSFYIPQPGNPPSNSYRLVPHMRPPKLPAGAPKLLP